MTGAQYLPNMAAENQRNYAAARMLSSHAALYCLDVPIHLPVHASQQTHPSRSMVVATYQSVTASSHNLISCSLVPAK